MCIYLSFAGLFGSTKLREIAITLQSQQEWDWLPTSDKTCTSNSSPIFSNILRSIAGISVSDANLWASYLCLRAVPSSGASRNLFWYSNTVLPSSSRFTSSAPSVCDVSSLQLLLPGEKYLTGVISFFDKHIISALRDLGVIV